MRRTSCVLLLSCVTASCAHRAASTRDATTTTSSATGTQPGAREDVQREPLIVDMPARRRRALQQAMRRGVAVVAYDRRGMRLLDCRLRGGYGFFALPARRSLVRLVSPQEVLANLPLSGAALRAELGAGQTVDIALVTVGKRRTTWREATFADLHGSCAGATHFVRGATVGAFALAIGHKDRKPNAVDVRAAARASAGDPAACRQQLGVGTRGAPAGCAVLLRLQLERIRQRVRRGLLARWRGLGAPRAGGVARCPAGLVLSRGKCTQAATAHLHQCRLGDARDCREQCRRGHAGSCDSLGVMYYNGRGVAVDRKRAAPLFAKACKLGSGSGCHNSGLVHYFGRGVAKDRARAASDFVKACVAGVVKGCYAAGVQRYAGDGVSRDFARAAAFFRRACDGGHNSACTNLAVMHMGGVAVPKDDRKAFALNERACHGAVAVACGNVGLFYEFGIGRAVDKKRAVEHFRRACALLSSACIRLAIAYQSGFGVQRDDARARSLYDQACRTKEHSSITHIACGMLDLLYGAPRQMTRKMRKYLAMVMKPQCDKGVVRACGFLAASSASFRDADASKKLRHACNAGDYWACDIEKRLARKRAAP